MIASLFFTEEQFDTQRTFAKPIEKAATKIKQHYKKLAKLNHPDKNQGDTGAEERLKDINIAYSILKQLYPEAASKLK